MRKRKYKNSITFFVTDEMYKHIKDVSKKNSESLGEFLRQAVQAVMDKNCQNKE